MHAILQATFVGTNRRGEGSPFVGILAIPPHLEVRSVSRRMRVVASVAELLSEVVDRLV
jgi:hypothetical protein